MIRRRAIGLQLSTCKAEQTNRVRSRIIDERDSNMRVTVSLSLLCDATDKNDEMAC